MQPETQGAAGDGKPDAGKTLPPPQKMETPKLDASIALWLVLFVFGGGLLALYYAGIEYFPEVSWQDALTYMALMTIIGGSLLLAYSFLLFVPGAIWSEFLIFDRQLHEVLMMGARDWEPCVLSITKRIVFPFALFMAFCHSLLSLQYENGLPGYAALGAAASLAAVSGLLWRDLRKGLELAATVKAAGQPMPAGAALETSTIARHRWFVGALHIPLVAVFLAKEIFSANPGAGVLWTVALLPLVGLASLLVNRWRESRPRPNSPLDEGREVVPGQGWVPDKRSLLCRAILAFGSAALLSLVALWFFYRIYEEKDSGTSGAPLDLLLMCTLVVVVTNLAVSVLFHKHRRSAIMASLLAALLLLGAGQLLGKKAEARLPARIMANFGFGGQSATLVLTEKGGRLLCEQAIPVKFEERAQPEIGGAGSAGDSSPEKSPGNLDKAVKDKPREERRFARVAGAKILSRLGSEYLVFFKKQNRTVAVPKSEVASWSTGSPIQEPEEDGCKPPSGSHPSPPGT